MIKVNKNIEFIIDGDEAKLLSDICELARIFIQREDPHSQRHTNPNYLISSYTSKEIQKMENLMEKIFEA